LKRAVADSPSGGYAPGPADCPAERPRVRIPSSLSREETDWLQTRRNNTIEPLRELLGRLRISGFDAPAYIQANRNNASALPNVAIAASGGGYRALMNGAGAIAAFDSRTPNATSPGHLGGLLQSATYLAGLSGGAWLVGSIYVNNFTTIQALQAPNAPTWSFERSILEGPSRSGFSVSNIVEYYKSLQAAVASKASAGFNTSITDYW
jgi:lysophospholipase